MNFLIFLIFFGGEGLGAAMASEGIVEMVEDVVLQHGKRLCDVDLASRKANEACMIIFLLFFSMCVCVCLLIAGLSY